MTSLTRFNIADCFYSPSLLDPKAEDFNPEVKGKHPKSFISSVYCYVLDYYYYFFAWMFLIIIVPFFGSTFPIFVCLLRKKMNFFFPWICQTWHVFMYSVSTFFLGEKQSDAIIDSCYFSNPSSSICIETFSRKIYTETFSSFFFLWIFKFFLNFMSLEGWITW